jgi:lipopolysaccharide assembly protein A
MKYLRIAVLILLFFLSMLFFVQNQEILSKTTRLYLSIFGLELHSTDIAYYLIVLLAFVAGGFISMAYFLTEKIRQGAELKRRGSKIKDLEEELKSLRNMPLEESDYTMDSPESQEPRV